MNKRKQDHLRILADDPQTDRNKGWFDGVKLKHRALPQIDLDEVDTSISFIDKTLSFPLIISCMTGGDGEDFLKINRNLAQAAEATGVALGVGSQRVMLEDNAAAESFRLREYAPNVLLFGNLGAVQLNNGVGLDDCRRLVETCGVDALYLHLNPLQEAIQPEGNTNFGNLAQRIADIVEGLDVPVIVKEVGCGIGPDDALLLMEAGVRYIDVAGSGGTSWSRIESHRSDDSGETGIAFQDWGLPTPETLRQLMPLCRGRAELIASGGIRSGIDMVKALVLGASACGIAAPFIKPAMESPEAVVAHIEELRRQFRIAMFLLGAKTASELVGNSLIYEL
jgi:isopentenyl-diphosphate delta-isomerase